MDPHHRTPRPHTTATAATRAGALRVGLAALIAVGVSVALWACGSGQASSSASPESSTGPAGFSVSPMNHTPDASPSSQISFLGPQGTQVSSVTVVGSRSGQHTGRLESYSTQTGASFLPDKRFLSGERVTVHAQLTADGAQQNLSSTFTIASQASVPRKPFPNNPGDPHAVQHYASAPTLTPSTVRVTLHARPGAAPGYLFLAPYQGMGSAGPMIVDQNGGLVWFHRLAAGDTATNFQVQTYQGRAVLTWWQGKVLGVGFGEGEDVIYDSSYRKVAEIKAGNSYHADLHEIRLTPEGTAWIDAFDPIHMDLSSVGGSKHAILTDSVIQEIDIKTGLVMWEWHALGHIPLRESFNPVSHGEYPWDYVHINSVDPGSSGDVLLSARNTWALYDVSMLDGSFKWQLGGRRSTFKLGSGVRFYWQHDAEFQPDGLISVFDNGSTPPKERASRGLLLRANATSHTVTLAKALVNRRQTLLAASQGNTLSLPNGNWLMGYGGLPNFTEYDAHGHVLLDGTLGRNVQDFRTYLSPWSATPTGSPSIAVQGSAPHLRVLASWNGATAVASWQVLAGTSTSTLAPVGEAVARHGFQTQISVASSGPLVAVRALDGSGSVLGTSRALTVH